MSDKYDNVVVIMNYDAEGFRVNQIPTPELVDLMNAHEDRLRAVLDKPVILSVHWNDGDQSACVTVMPTECAKGDENKPFNRFMLPFPKKEGNVLRWPQ